MLWQDGRRVDHRVLGLPGGWVEAIADDHDPDQVEKGQQVERVDARDAGNDEAPGLAAMDAAVEPAAVYVAHDEAAEDEEQIDHQVGAAEEVGIDVPRQQLTVQIDMEEDHGERGNPAQGVEVEEIVRGRTSRSLWAPRPDDAPRRYDLPPAIDRIRRSMAGAGVWRTATGDDAFARS